MGTPKKPVKKKAASKSPGAKKPDPSPDPQLKKRIIDDEDDEEEFDIPLEELGGYDSLDEFEDDDDY